MPNMNGDFDTGYDDEVWLSHFENDLLDEEDDFEPMEEHFVDEELDDIEDELYIQEFLSRRREEFKDVDGKLDVWDFVPRRTEVGL